MLKRRPWWRRARTRWLAAVVVPVVLRTACPELPAGAQPVCRVVSAVAHEVAHRVLGVKSGGACGPNAGPGSASQ